MCPRRRARRCGRWRWLGHDTGGRRDERAEAGDTAGPTVWKRSPRATTGSPAARFLRIFSCQSARLMRSRVEARYLFGGGNESSPAQSWPLLLCPLRECLARRARRATARSAASSSFRRGASSSRSRSHEESCDEWPGRIGGRSDSALAPFTQHKLLYGESSQLQRSTHKSQQVTALHFDLDATSRTLIALGPIDGNATSPGRLARNVNGPDTAQLELHPTVGSTNENHEASRGPVHDDLLKCKIVPLC